MVLVVKKPPANARDIRMRVRSLGQEDPLGAGMATHSSILAWEIPWTEEPGELQSIGTQRVRHNLALTHTHTHTPTHTHTRIRTSTYLSFRETHRIGLTTVELLMKNTTFLMKHKSLRFLPYAVSEAWSPKCSSNSHRL